MLGAFTAIPEEPDFCYLSPVLRDRPYQTPIHCFPELLIPMPLISLSPIF
jgi:hypothetical protein